MTPRSLPSAGISLTKRGRIRRLALGWSNSYPQPLGAAKLHRWSIGSDGKPVIAAEPDYS
jgi:hypothetical protein